MSAREALRAHNISYFVHAEQDSFRGKVLDVGCGAKPYKRMFPQLAWTGLDIRPVGEVEADFHDIPLDDDSFDTVLCTDALQFAKDPARVFSEMARVLRPGGLLLAVAPGTDVDDSTAIWGFRIQGLTMLASEAGLAVERVARVDFPNGGQISGAMHDYNEIDKGTYTIGPEALGWARKMDELMPTMVGVVASNPAVGG